VQCGNRRIALPKSWIVSWSASSERPLTNSDVEKLTRTSSAALVLDTIEKAQELDFDLSDERGLKDNGVSQEVIGEMRRLQQRQLSTSCRAIGAGGYAVVGAPDDAGAGLGASSAPR
jgi:hypothetical protein